MEPSAEANGNLLLRLESLESLLDSLIHPSDTISMVNTNDPSLLPSGNNQFGQAQWLNGISNHPPQGPAICDGLDLRVRERRRSSQKGWTGFLQGAPHADVESQAVEAPSKACYIRKCHPSPSDLFVLWDIFVQNVVPLVKIFHPPTTRKLFMDAAMCTDLLEPDTEAFMFAIYYSAVNSLADNQCRVYFQKSRASLLESYGSSWKIALGSVSHPDSWSLVVFQGAILFGVCLRESGENSDFESTLISTLIYAAQKAGLHQVESGLTHATLDTEIRRRLWWQILLLDIRRAEECGCNPISSQINFNTRLPLSITETSDLSPDAEKGNVEMMFFSMRCQLVDTSRWIYHMANGPDDGGWALVAVKRILDTTQMLGSRYLCHLDPEKPFHWLIMTSTRLMNAKLWLSLYQLMSLHAKKMAPGAKEQMLSCATEVMKLSNLLQTNASTLQWSWLSKTYIQQPATALLSESDQTSLPAS